MGQGAISDSGVLCALVTGGADGIGWAVCRELAARGYRVVIADLNGELAEQRAQTLGTGHTALQVDLTDTAQCDQLLDRAIAACGRLDVLINNAGATDTSGRTLIDLPQERFDALIALNLEAVERLCASALDKLPAGGAIVNLASGAAYVPLALRGPYSATKAGVVALTRALAADAREKNMSITAVAPGYTRTPLIESLAVSGRVNLEDVAKKIPLGRLATTHDIATVVAFGCSDAAGAVNGETLLVDGGGSLGVPMATPVVADGPASGGLLVLGDVELAADEQVTEGKPVTGLIDARHIDHDGSAAELLRKIRAAAIGCERDFTRAKDFAWTIVLSNRRNGSNPTALAAALMLIRTLALEWAKIGVRINAVVWQSASRNSLPALCRFLASSDAAFMTGQVIHAGDT